MRLCSSDVIEADTFGWELNHVGFEKIVIIIVSTTCTNATGSGSHYVFWRHKF